MSSKPKYEVCQTCGERGVPVAIEGGTVYSYPCTAEVVVLHGGHERVIKNCPNLGKIGRWEVL